MNFARKKQRLLSFAPNQDAVKIIARALDANADTLCYVHVIGDKYSFGRLLAAALPHGPFRRASDALFVELICLQVDGAKVLWIDHYDEEDLDPLEPGTAFVEALTKNLPARGVPFRR